jgi:hypothetical protein
MTFSGGPQVDLRRIHSNSSGYVVKRTAANAYDWLYVLGSDGSEYLIRECLAGRRAVNLKNSYKLHAAQFTLGPQNPGQVRGYTGLPAGCQSGRMGQS